MNVLVTGGAGYISSHTYVELILLQTTLADVEKAESL
jgi:UDP-glucose 4-epimerase